MNYDAVNTIGCDETGSGDLFGPMVACSCFVPLKNITILKELGVKDSKRISDSVIKRIAKQLIDRSLVEYELTFFKPPVYNSVYGLHKNMNVLKAILHNEALYRLTKRIPSYDNMLMDQFCSKTKYYEYLETAKRKSCHVSDIVHGLDFEYKGESKSVSVAAASILARACMLELWAEMEHELGFDIPLGSTHISYDKAVHIFENQGVETLKGITKNHFKTYIRIVSGK